MANCCPKCGATVTGDYSVCVVCDALLGDPATAPPIVPWQPASSPSGSARARITLRALVVVAAVGIALAVVRVANAPGRPAASPLPLSTNKPALIGASGLGVDLYPGATQQQRTARRTPNRAVLTATFSTSEPLDAVIDFYQVRLGPPVSHNHGSAVFAASSEDRKDSVLVTLSAPAAGPTTIGILHSTTR